MDCSEPCPAHHDAEPAGCLCRCQDPAFCVEWPPNSTIASRATLKTIIAHFWIGVKLVTHARAR